MTSVSIFKKALVLSLSFATMHSAYAVTFGVSGRDGRSGRDGSDGRSAPSEVVTVTGAPIRLNLAGTDAIPGERAEDGEDAYGCSEPTTIRDNLYGASGGDAGRGGRGGDGGNGGDVTLYYSELAQLSKVLIFAPGGRGAFGGQSGRVGRPCVCTLPEVSFRDCAKDAQGKEVCKIISYSCTNGGYGRSYSDGNSGGSGRPGSILLVKSPKQLTSDSPYVGASLGELFSSATPLTLSRNLFEVVPGVGGLLAPGSVVASTGSEFVRLKTVPISSSWSTPQNLQSLAGESVRLSLDSSGSLDVDFGALWVDSTVTENIDGTDRAHVDVKAVYHPEDIANLSFDNIESSGKSVVAQINDLKHLPTDVPVTFTAALETKVLVFWKDRWAGEVPASLVKKVGSQYQIAVGQLPIDPQYMSGHRTRITITATFSMGGKTKSFRVARIASL
jgi:hypothetical protein